MSESREIIIQTEMASRDGFAAFGELLAPPDGDPVYRGIQASSWPTGFACADTVQLMYTRFGYQEPVFTKLERHRGITQTFVPLLPRRFVMVVAPVTHAGTWPEPETIRAFLVPPGQGVIIGDNVWHALDRFLIEPEPLDCVMLTSAAVQAELEVQYRGGEAIPQRTDVIDYAGRGLKFRLDLSA